MMARTPEAARRNREHTAQRKREAGGPLMPPYSLPYRALAATCPRCGEFNTTPDQFLRRDAGKYRGCPRCHDETMRKSRARWEARNPEGRAISAAKHRGTSKNRRAQHKAWAKVQGRTLETATRSGELWTPLEVEIAMRADLTLEQAARMTGRTLAATQKRRQMMRKDPRWIHGSLNRL